MLRLRTAVRDADPGIFALVMATCIVSRAMQLDGAARLSGILLAAAIVAYVLLAADAHPLATAVLLVAGGASWVLLSYLLPPLLAGHALAGASGSWFLWPVASQSVAAGLTSWPSPLPPWAAAAAVACWAVGVILYLLVTGLVTAARLAFPVRPAELTPAYWVFMGASAISVLAGAQILRLPSSPLTAATHAVVAGLSVMLWAFGTWLVPYLVILGVWRHVRCRVPLAYEPGMWSIVFPVGMYGVASRELGSALHVPWLVTLGRYEAWLALAVWALVFLAMTPGPAAVSRGTPRLAPPLTCGLMGPVRPGGPGVPLRWPPGVPVPD